jgi:hypothetical protein
MVDTRHRRPAKGCDPVKRFLTLVLLLATVNCRPQPPRPPIPPVTPPSPTMTVAMTVVTDDRGTVPGLTCVMVPDNAPATACDYSSGVRANWTLPSAVEFQGGELRLTADGYESFIQRVLIQREMGEHTMAVDAIRLPRLQVRGEYLQLETGQRWTEIETSDFNLLSRYAAGEDITPVLLQRQDVGFNTLRVWTAYDLNNAGIGQLFPSPSVYTAIPGFVKLCARYGFYVEFTGFTGPYSTVFVDDDAKVNHWENLISATVGLPNVYLELVNEYSNPPNVDIPMSRFRRPMTVLASHGSDVQDAMPPQPFWDLVTYRPGGGGEWQRKVGHNAWEDVASWANVPTISNETTRFPDSDSNINHAYDAAAGAALMAAGAAFHSVHGKNSTLFVGGELDAARAWVAGARSVPLACQGQPYRNLSGQDASYLRIYQRGGDPACIVRIRP